MALPDIFANIAGFLAVKLKPGFIDLETGAPIDQETQVAARRQRFPGNQDQIVVYTNGETEIIPIEKMPTVVGEVQLNVEVGQRKK